MVEGGIGDVKGPWIDRRSRASIMLSGMPEEASGLSCRD